MAQEWFVTDAAGRVEGPLSGRELQARAADGRLRPGDRVSRDRERWVRAEKVKGLTFAAARPEPRAASAALETQFLPPSTTPDPTPLPAGDRDTVADLTDIPGYEIYGVLGRGACGVVFRARQQKLDRVVALKTVTLDGPGAGTAVSRFEQEAVALAKLAHPHIVAVYDSGHHDGRVFFAMELLDGEDLLRRMDRGPIDERAVWWIARQTAAALSHAAQSGVFHRDIKPANLFLVPPPTGFALPPGVPMVKVTDFGLALTKQTADLDTNNRLTAAGVVLGTPAYMAPEQFASSDIDHRADIYSLGATVFHMLAGRPPFDGWNVWEVMLKKTEPAPRLGPPASDESVELVAAMLAEKPDERVGSYEELIERIDALPCMTEAAGERAAGFASVRVQAVKDRPRKRRWLYVAAAVGGLAIAGVFAAIGGGKKPAESGPDAKGGGATGPVRYVSSGFSDALFDGEDVRGWAGPGWVPIEDEDNNKVLQGAGSVRRPLPLPLRRHYRVQFGLNLHEATAVDVVAAVGDGPPETATRWVLRITKKDGAVFGKREGGERGAFVPLAEAVPFPTAAELAGKIPYQGVQVEKSGGKVSVAYRDRPAGSVDDDGKLRVAEVRLLIDGGPVRVLSPTVEELAEQR